MSKILLCDDMIDLIKEEAMLLEECGLGYEVQCTSNPASVSEFLSKDKFDLVILDIMMPKFNGIEVLHHIKRKYHVPVLVYSGFLDKIPLHTLYAEGADQVLSKPAPLDLFLNTIRGMLDPNEDSTLIIVSGYKIKEVRNQILRQLIQKVLGKTSNNIHAASKLMGVSRECLSQMMKRLGVIR
jgi:DNA-binding NtrC family response regulator